jgi:hypothetical protein
VKSRIINIITAREAISPVISTLFLKILSLINSITRKPAASLDYLTTCPPMGKKRGKIDFRNNGDRIIKYLFTSSISISPLLTQKIRVIVSIDYNLLPDKSEP